MPKAGDQARAGAASTNGEVSPGVKKEEDSDDEDLKMSDVEDNDDTPADKKSSPETPSLNGDILKRKRGGTDSNTLDEPDTSPSKKFKSHSPPPPPPPPGPPAETPTNSVSASPMELQQEAQTGFATKSMADVLASAQQDCDTPEEEEDVHMVELKEEDVKSAMHLDGANPSSAVNGSGVRQNGHIEDAVR